MRLNKYLANNSQISRRGADEAIRSGRVLVNGKSVDLGYDVLDSDKVTLDGRHVSPRLNTETIILNKPPGFVCSRDGQGSQTIYDLIPSSLHHLKSVGRLDKYSSGLLLMTSDGDLAYNLTHPKFQKLKIYKIALNKPLSTNDLTHITKEGVMLEDGLSKLILDHINRTDYQNWKITMHEGRNRQIRRTFELLGYSLPKLHRTHFGDYELGNLKSGQITKVD